MPISLSGSLVLTGSITTTGGITISGSILSASYSATSSFSNDFTVLGNLTVFGTQSVQYITSSQLNVSDNVITVNVASPGVRFGGLSVFDSGSQSSEATASLFWDSQQNHWIYQRESGSTYTGGMLISGPRNAAGLGNESGTTACMLLVGQGGDHLTSSLVYHDSNITCFYTNATLACSNNFGSNLNLRQTFTGSMFVTGAVNFRTNQNFVLNSSSTGWISSFVNDYNNTSYIGVDNDGMYMQPSSKGTKVVAGNGTTYLYVTSSGIGIGNTNPKATLHLGPSLNTMPSATSIAVAGDTSIRFTAGSDGNADYGSYIAGTQYAGVRALSLGYRQGSGDILTMTITQLSENTGSVGIGTTTPGQPLEVKSANGQGIRLKNAGSSDKRWDIVGSGNDLRINETGVGATMTFEAGGNVGIGITDPAKKLDIYDTNGNATAQLKLRNAGTTAAAYLGAFSGNLYLSAGGSYDSGWSTDGTNGIANIVMETTNGGSAIAFGTAASNTSPAERMRIDSVGRVTVNSPNTYVFTVSNTTNTSGQGVFVTALGSNNNNASSYHYIAATGGADKFYLFGNGTYQTVSDIRLKKNVTTVTDTYLDKLKDLRVVNYNWKDQEDGHPLEFGLIAQEVEALIPSIVHEGREHEDNIKYKGIQASVLPYILIKAIQELKAEFDSYKETHP